MPEPRFRLLMLLVGTLVATGVSFWEAPYPSELRLQHIPTVVGIIGLWLVVEKRWLSPSSVLCLLAFLWLHLIGARWIYSFVPYDRWATCLCGISISELCGWQRNHYDRLVHLASGVLFVPPTWEFVSRRGLTGSGVLAVVSVSVVLAIGAVYEVLEWAISLLFAPAYAESYNGQQGDMWDPQKDLALAGVGAIVMAAWLMGRSRSACVTPSPPAPAQTPREPSAFSIGPGSPSPAPAGSHPRTE